MNTSRNLPQRAPEYGEVLDPENPGGDNPFKPVKVKGHIQCPRCWRMVPIVTGPRAPATRCPGCGRLYHASVVVFDESTGPAE